MNRMIIDTDPGVDDAHAIMMALADPDTSVEAIMTVAGNVPLERTSANALTILDICEQDVPVYPGCEKAIIAVQEDASVVHGNDGLGNVNYPPSSRQLEDEHAIHALIRMARAEPGVFTLVTLGPLTNIGLATRLAPDLPGLFKRLVVMGGATRAIGNTTRVAVEYNFYADPEAAAIVFQTWKGIELVTWETTVDHALLPQQADELGSLDNPHSDFYGKITADIRRYMRESLRQDLLFTADPLAMAVALDPAVVQRSEEHYVEIELGGRHTRGQSVVDWYATAGQEANTRIMLELKKDRLFELLLSAVAS